MIYGNDRDIQEMRSFDSFWAPDYRGSDIWQVQGFLHDRRSRYVDFAFRAELMRIGAGSFPSFPGCK